MGVRVIFNPRYSIFGKEGAEMESLKTRPQNTGESESSWSPQKAEGSRIFYGLNVRFCLKSATLESASMADNLSSTQPNYGVTTSYAFQA
jgi:hypothetical protein